MLVQVVLVVQQTVRFRHFAEQTVRQALRQAVQVRECNGLGQLTRRLIAAGLTNHGRIASLAKKICNSVSKSWCSICCSLIEMRRSVS